MHSSGKWETFFEFLHFPVTLYSFSSVFLQGSSKAFSCFIYCCSFHVWPVLIIASMYVHAMWPKRQHMKCCPSTTENIISHLPEYIWPTNLAGWWLSLRGSYQYSRITLSLCDVARSRDKLKTYLHYHNEYGHQTCQGGKILREAPSRKLAWLLDKVALWSHVTN